MCFIKHLGTTTVGGIIAQGIGKHGIFKLVSAYSVGRCGTYPAFVSTS